MRLLFISLTFLCSGIPMAAAIAGEGAHHTFRYLTSSGNPQTLQTMVFSPDSTQLVISAGSGTDVIDVEKAIVTRKIKGSPFSMGFSKIGDRLYGISTYKATLLDMRTGQTLQPTYEKPPGYLGVSLEQVNGKLVISRINPDGPVGKEGGIQLGDELVGVGSGRNGSVSDVTGYSVQRAIDAMGGYAGTYVTLRVIPKGKFGEDNARSHIVRRLPATVIGGLLRFDKEGMPPADLSEALVWCVSEGHHEFRSAATGTPKVLLQSIDIHNVGQYALSPDQTKFAIVSSMKEHAAVAVEVFDLMTQERIALMTLPKNTYTAIAFSGDGQHILVGTHDTIEIADLRANRFTRRLTLGAEPKKAADEKQESSPSTAAGAVLLSVAKEVDHGYSSGRKQLTAMAVSSRGIVATADLDGNVNLWDFDSGQLLKKVPMGVDEDADMVLFSPDGNWLAFYVEGTLHLVDVSQVRSDSPTPSDATEPQRRLVLKVGEPVEIFSRGDWISGTIAREEGNGRWWVRYDEMPVEWEELATLIRLRAPGAE